MAKTPEQKFVGLELSAMDVDGQACDNMLMCLPRPVTTNATECPFDYVRIYDGPDETSPTIATLCGKWVKQRANFLIVIFRPGIANLENSEGGISVEWGVFQLSGGILVFRLRGGYFWKIPPPQKGGKNRKFGF